MPRRRWSNKLHVSLLPLIVAPPLNAIMNSWRVEREVAPETRALLEQGQPVVYALWHGRMYGILRGFDPKSLGILISPSTDGEMICRVARRLGFPHFIRGSHKRGGSQAIRGMLRELNRNRRSIVFTVDGPRGPRHKVKPGVIKIASQAEVPIVPVVPACQRLLHKFEKSWDHFHAPLPFTPMAICFGAPLFVPPNLKSDEEVRPHVEALETALLSLTRRADARYGRQHLDE